MNGASISVPCPACGHVFQCELERDATPGEGFRINLRPDALLLHAGVAHPKDPK